jgi:hypothetical protein
MTWMHYLTGSSILALRESTAWKEVSGIPACNLRLFVELGSVEFGAGQFNILDA